MVIEEPAPPPPPPPRPQLPQLPSARLKIGLALRIGLLTAAILFFLNLLAAEASVVWLLAIGFLAVFFYQRRNGRVSLGGGARLGWISGLTSFVLFAVPSLVYLAVRPDYVQLMVEQLKKSGLSPGLRDRMLEALQMPVAVQALGALVVFTVFPLIGGLIGAKLLKKSG